MAKKNDVWRKEFHDQFAIKILHDNEANGISFGGLVSGSPLNRERLVRDLELFIDHLLIKK